jgi:hypothetical protein
MSDSDHARALLDMAKGDVNALRGMAQPSLLETDFFSDEIFGFHAQQAVEKILKAWLSSKGVRYPRTHDLMAIISSLEDAGENVDDLRELVDLNPFAVQYRYETLDNDEEPVDREGLIPVLV